MPSPAPTQPSTAGSPDSGGHNVAPSRQANVRTPRMGRASNTEASYDRAVLLFNVYQRQRGEPELDSLTMQHIAEENLEFLLAGYLTWLSVTTIRRGFDADLNSDNFNAIVVSTKLQYAGQLKEELKRRFPQHRLLHVSADETWWSQLREDFRRAARREQNMTPEEEFGEPKKRPLYRDLRGNRQLLPSSLSVAQTTDLRSVLLNLMARYGRFHNSGDVMERCAQLVMTCCAVGRGGECKFSNFNDWVYDPFFEVTDIWWRELKTLNAYSMPMGPNKSDWVTDFYHAMGRYWFMEKGLLRREPDAATTTFVFPSLHQMANSSVSQCLTNSIRKNLPEELASEEHVKYSCKSMRSASQTEMAAHPSVGFYESHARSGHSIGTSQESYVDRRSLAASLRPMRSLCGWEENLTTKRLPRLECLGSHNQEEAKRFLKQMFPHDLPQFFDDQAPLFPVLKAACATMIMYHNDVMADCGPEFPVYDSLRNLANDCELQDCNADSNSPPAVVLQEWSSIIKRDFDSMNREVGFIGEGGTATQVMDMMNRMADSVAKSGELLNDLTNQNKELRQCNRILTDKIVSMSQSLQDQDLKVQRLLCKLHCFKTPDRPVSHPPTTRPYEGRRLSLDAPATNNAPPTRPTTAIRGPSPQGRSTPVGSPQQTSQTQRRSPASQSQSGPEQSQRTTSTTESSESTSSQLTGPESEGPSGQHGGQTGRVPTRRRKRRRTTADLHHGAEAGIISRQKKDQTGGKSTITNLISYYHNKGKLTDEGFKFASFEPPDFISDSSLIAKCRNVLRLMDRVTGITIRRQLVDKNLTPKRLDDLCHAISSHSMAEMATLERTAPIKPKSNHDCGKLKPTVGALGNRIRLYKTDNSLQALPPREEGDDEEEVPNSLITRFIPPIGRGPRYPRNASSSNRLSVEDSQTQTSPDNPGAAEATNPSDAQEAVAATGVTTPNNSTDNSQELQRHHHPANPHSSGTQRSSGTQLTLAPSQGAPTQIYNQENPSGSQVTSSPEDQSDEEDDDIALADLRLFPKDPTPPSQVGGTQTSEATDALLGRLQANYSIPTASTADSNATPRTLHSEAIDASPASSFETAGTPEREFMG